MDVSREVLDSGLDGGGWHETLGGRLGRLLGRLTLGPARTAYPEALLGRGPPVATSGPPHDAALAPVGARGAVTEASLRAAVESSGEAIGVSANGLHAMVSPAYVRMFGFDRADQLQGTPILDVIAPESRGLMKRHFRNRLDGRKAPTEYEVVALRKDGSRFAMRVRASVIEVDGIRHCAVALHDLGGCDDPRTGTAAPEQGGGGDSSTPCGGVPLAQVRNSTSQ